MILSAELAANESERRGIANARVICFGSFAGGSIDLAKAAAKEPPTLSIEGQHWRLCWALRVSLDMAWHLDEVSVNLSRVALAAAPAAFCSC